MTRISAGETKCPWGEQPLDSAGTRCISVQCYRIIIIHITSHISTHSGISCWLAEEKWFYSKQSSPQTHKKNVPYYINTRCVSQHVSDEGRLKVNCRPPRALRVDRTEGRRRVKLRWLKGYISADRIVTHSTGQCCPLQVKRRVTCILCREWWRIQRVWYED